MGTEERRCGACSISISCLVSVGLLPVMRKAGAYVASVAAAGSSMVLLPPAGSASPDPARQVLPACYADAPGSPSKMETAASAPPGGAPEDRFAPRFDGLRFIETLVTAHR